jgi:hypothetical protein
MIVYVGQTRSASWIRRCTAQGFREMTVRGELPPRRQGWAYDNGAYKDWKADKPFDLVRYTRDLRRIRNEALKPDFIVLPDVPGDGKASLAFTLEWLEWTQATIDDDAQPLYLAVQDGMEPANICGITAEISGIFVGGTLDWKLVWGGTWAKWAHRRGLKCHVGRVGTAQRVRWAQKIEADSIDSCQPLRNETEFERFCRAVNPDSFQGKLFDATDCDLRNGGV